MQMFLVVYHCQHTLFGPTPQPTETVLLFEQLQNSPVAADQIKLDKQESSIAPCVEMGTKWLEA